MWLTHPWATALLAEWVVLATLWGRFMLSAFELSLCVIAVLRKSKDVFHRSKEEGVILAGLWLLSSDKYVLVLKIRSSLPCLSLLGPLPSSRSLKEILTVGL
ncbi:hypothetical protein BKA63DRAFT_524232 [Paraphoma chrysanthemicola]|nr:hypothetical protein BKA63DRAFT_524232 [Paraphoma chrysanthemicola]